MDYFLIYGVVVISILSALLFIINWGSLKLSEKYFGYITIVSAIFEVIALATIYLGQDTNNLPGLHLYTLIKFILTCLFFGSLLTFDKVKKVTIVTIIFGCVAILLNSIFVQSIYEFNSFSKTGVDLFCILLSIVFFISILKYKNDIEGLKPVIYFVIALFFNSSITSILYLFSNEIMQMIDSLRNKLWVIVVGMNLITQIIIILGIRQIYKSNNKGKLSY